MKITFYAHACFRLEGSGLAIITDPFNPSVSGYEPINEAADIVIRSSDNDRYHSDPSHVRGDPSVVTATSIPPEGVTVKGLAIKALPVMESLTHDYGRPAKDNAMYTFTLDGVRVFHMGDLGNAFTQEQLDVLKGNVDVALALTGAHATIALDDLVEALDAIQPKAVIPMHYWHERGTLNIEPVTSFTDLFPAKRVTRVDNTSITFTPDTLPEKPYHIYVLEQAR